VFILFFVFIGAKLNPQAVSPALALFIVLYLAGRTAGKMSGAWCGAGLAGAGAAVRKYLPFCLFSQAGVAVGLSLVAAQDFSAAIGDAIVIIITISTFIVQLIGPYCVKFAITRSGESGKDITEEDITRTASVEELMDPRYPVVGEDTPAQAVVEIFSASPYTQYPVVDSAGKLSGVINIDGIKNSLAFDRSDRLLLGADLKEQFTHAIPASASVFEAKARMDRFQLGFLPVTDKDGIIVGGFDRRMYKKFVSARLLQMI
jgi:CBS domain-containing protein